jgi:hypothetical protein
MSVIPAGEIRALSGISGCLLSRIFTLRRLEIDGKPEF